MANGTANPEGGQPATGQTGTYVDPYRSFQFKIEIQGVTEGHFTRCSGMGMRIQAIAYREAGQSQVVRRIPGQLEYGDVVLSWGLTTSREMWDWFLSAVQGKVVRKNVSIVMMDSDGVTEAMRWNLINAWPAEWNGAALDSLGREVAIESMTLVFETLERG
jgi:phage tail-like protein